MSPLIQGLTIGLLLLPLVFAIAAWVTQQAGLAGVALFLGVLYAGVWFGCRPTYFQVTDRDLTIVFPVWQRSVPIVTVTAVRQIGPTEFRQRFGSALRVGVGGLWGGFGWLWTSRGGWVEFYVSRTDHLVLIERSGHLPLLITPRSPQHFIGVLGISCDRGAP